MSFIVAIIILSILTLTFNIGRFVMARRLKLPVEKFVIGIEWGKPIFTKKINDIELVIYPLCWGGFTEFEEGFDPAIKCNRAQKSMLTFASFFMMTLTMLLLGLTFINFVPSGKYETLITAGSETSLLKEGDKIISVNGTNITGQRTLYSITHKKNDFFTKLVPEAKNAERKAIVRVERGDEQLTLKLPSLEEFNSTEVKYQVKPIYLTREEIKKTLEKNSTGKFDKKVFTKNLISILTMLILISFLVLVHEAGHYLAAKMFKMKVERFGFGLPFGPILWQKQCGETLVVVHAFLLGGYVAFPDDDKENNLPKDSPDRFVNKPIYQRLVVVSAGVFANIVAAIFLVFLTALLWGKLPTEDYQTYITGFSDEGKTNISTMKSGLKAGDKIVEINGSAADSAYALQLYAIKSRKFDGTASLEKVQQTLDKLEKLNPKISKVDYIPAGKLVRLTTWTPEEEIHLTDDMMRGFEKITDNKIALNDQQKALRNALENKTTYKADGTTTLVDLAFALSDTACPMSISVEREGKIIKLLPIYSNEKGLIGVKFDKQKVFVETKTLSSAFKESYSYLYSQTKMLLKGLWQLIAGKVPLENMHGVVAVVKYGGDVIQQDGFWQGLLLTALISLDLAIVNFLPIPALDGGHVLFLLIEKIYGKPLDEETVNSIATAGFLFLILLMVIVLYNDIVALALHKI